jgi:hypothetical protein
MKIVICGGGTAGWLAALMIRKVQKDSHDITVIDSSKIGIIGAGEGSTGYLLDIIQNNSWNYDCNEEDFFRETGATVKLGIEHRDWSAKGKTYFAPIDGTATFSQIPDTRLCYSLLNNLPFHTSSENGYYIEHNKANYWYENDKLSSTKSNAYHFDGHKVGQYFKKICVTDKVKHIDAEILDVRVDETGIKSLLLSNEQEIFADFFIDCTGFARKLVSALGVSWTSYSKNLTVNSAMPFLLNYEENEKIKPVTVAWAQGSGWMWKIPVAGRWGCGYVYDDNFISDDQAKDEIEKVLGKKIEPIKLLKFDTGRLDKPWYKNCLALGLAAAFAEPLEATSIHSTILQLTTFIFDYLKDTKEQTVNIGCQNIYNKKTTHMYDSFKDFLNLHYQTKRNDTEFWKWMSTGETKTEFVADILELVKNKIPKGADIGGFYGSAGSPLWNWILIGLGYINKEKAQEELNFYGSDINLTNLSWKLYDESISIESKKMYDNTEFIKKINGNHLS